MSRCQYLDPHESLRAALDARKVDDLKKLAALLPNIATKPARKDELVQVLERSLMGGGLTGGGNAVERVRCCGWS